MSKGTLKQAKTEDHGRPVMHNGNGEMVISGGKIDSVGGGIHVSGGNVKVTGGSIVLHRINGGRNNPTIWADHGAKVTIKKGTFTVPEDLTVMSASDKSSLTIYGGTFKSGLDVNSHAVRANGEGTEVKIKGGTFDGGVIDCFQSAKMTISGGWSNKIVVAYDNGAITINNFTIDQGSHPWGSMLILENNGKSMMVKGGKYISKQGVGYQGNVTFETTEDYKKWFDVKELTRK